MIELIDISKSFNTGSTSLKILAECNLQITGTKSIGILGPNGSGKSTLTRIILKLAKPDKGKVLFNGKDIWYMNQKDYMAYRKNVQVITQRPESSFDPRLKIYESIKEPLQIHRLCCNEKELSDMLVALQLDKSLLERYPHQLSGGEIQRMSICRALLLKPRLLILDEATSMLDISIQAQVLSILKKLKENIDIAYLIISHNKQVVEWMSEDIYFLHKHRLELLN